MAIYFPDEEVQNLNSEFIECLDQARKLSGVTFYLFHKKQMNGLNRQDVDLRCEDPHARFHIVRALMNAGLNRIGIYPDYVHVEYDRAPQNRLWIEKKGADEYTLDS